MEHHLEIRTHAYTHTCTHTYSFTQTLLLIPLVSCPRFILLVDGQYLCYGGGSGGSVGVADDDDALFYTHFPFNITYSRLHFCSRPLVSSFVRSFVRFSLYFISHRRMADLIVCASYYSCLFIYLFVVFYAISTVEFFHITHLYTLSFTSSFSFQFRFACLMPYASCSCPSKSLTSSLYLSFVHMRRRRHPFHLSLDLMRNINS